MEELVQQSFGANLLIMQIFGFFPPEKYKILYKIYAYLVYFFFTILIPFLAALNLILSVDVDIGQISDNAFLVCQSGCFVVKFLPFIKNHQKVKASIYAINHFPGGQQTAKHKEILAECIQTTRRNCRVFLTFYLITLINWAIIPFFLPGKNLPIEIWLPYDYKNDTKLYILSFIYAVAGVGNGALSSGVIDPLLAGLTTHATCQLKLLKYNLENLQKFSEGKNINYLSDYCGLLDFEAVYSKIKLCIQHHNAILDFVEMFEITYSLAIFMQFAASVVVICISCLRLTMVETFTFPFFAMIIFLVAMLSEIFLYCYYGTMLYEENLSLRDSVYMSEWYSYDIKSRKLLITLMERSKRPMLIAAGKILDVSLVTFTKILRRAYSLLAVLKNY